MSSVSTSRLTPSNEWHRTARRIYNATYVYFDEWMTERWGCWHTATAAELFVRIRLRNIRSTESDTDGQARKVLKQKFPDESILHSQDMTEEYREFAVLAINVVWEQLEDSIQDRAPLPSEWLPKEVVGPWLPK